ncbi:MAG: hypothetical protein HY287_00645 [Planctomycetes bacterium]|nr:hypothetical protein [Planctomycetota bacterium]
MSGAQAQVEVVMTSDQARFWRDLQKSVDKLDHVKGKLDDVAGGAGRAGKEFAHFGASAIEQLAGMAAGFVSVEKALELSVEGFDLWLEKTRQVGEASQKLATAGKSLATAQRPGMSGLAFKEGAELLSQFGFTDQQKGFDLIRQLQGVRGGDLTAGMESARTVLQGWRVGLPVELASETEAKGVSLGLPPGVLIKRTFEAARFAGANPSDMLGGAGGLVDFRGEDRFALAMLADLVKQKGAGGAASFEQIGRILSGQDQDPHWKRMVRSIERELGPGKENLLRGLLGKRIIEPEQLRKAGVKGRAGVPEAMSFALKDFGAILAGKYDLEHYDEANIFENLFAQLQREVPGLRDAEANRILGAKFEHELAADPKAAFARKMETEERLRGRALQKMGLSSVGPFGAFATYDESGRAIRSIGENVFGPFGWRGVLTRLEVPRYGTSMVPAEDEIEYEMAELRRGDRKREVEVRRPRLGGAESTGAGGGDLRAAIRELADTNILLRSAIHSFRGGPTLGKPGADR